VENRKPNFSTPSDSLKLLEDEEEPGVRVLGELGEEGQELVGEER